METKYTDKQQIVYLGDTLHYLFTKVTINIDPIDILDFFPMLKNRKATLETLCCLVNILLLTNKAHLLRETFSNNISATYYYDNNKFISMEEAVNRNIIPKPMNTEEVVSNLNILPSIMRYNKLNSTPIDDIDQYSEIRKEAIIATQCLNLVKNIDLIDINSGVYMDRNFTQVLNANRKSYTTYEFIDSIRSNQKENLELISKFLQHRKIDPFVASIILRDRNHVTKYLHDIRSNIISGIRICGLLDPFYHCIRADIILKYLLCKTTLLHIFGYVGSNIYWHMLSCEML